MREAGAREEHARRIGMIDGRQDAAFAQCIGNVDVLAIARIGDDAGEIGFRRDGNIRERMGPT